MGTILTVHGTFAHLELPGSPQNSESSTSYWWRTDSPFVTELKGLVSGTDGAVDVRSFEWSGNNSVRDRRKAGHRLFLELQKLEAEGKPYCIIGHSHGGSVTSEALLEAAAKYQRLPGLKRWVTIGTPFVELRRERFLFMRLPLLLKAMYVAALMLFLFFVGATIGRFFEGDLSFENSRQVWRLGISGLFAALPIIVFLLIVLMRERYLRFFNRFRVRTRAQEFFDQRWLGMTHEDDEVVRGLATLRGAALPIFDRQFAVPLLSFFAVFMLPTAYLYVINSPTLMMGLSEMLRTQVYQLDQLERRAEAYQTARRSLRSLRVEMQDARKTLDDTLRPLDQREAARKVIAERREEVSKRRDVLHQQFPDLPQLQRAVRFQRKFLEKDGQICNQGKLCGNGKNRSLNAQLLLHLITDEVSSLFVDEEVRRGIVGRLATYLLPVILVPVVFGVIAIVWVLIVQAFAGLFSRTVSQWLDLVTWHQIRRTAVGNDTEDEVAVGTSAFPTWIETNRQFLPMVVSAAITECANEATLRSIGKFRDAISELAFSETNTMTTDKLLAYMSWDELIHTSYFCVPAFTRLVAMAIAETDGFEPAGDLSDQEARLQVANWLVELQQGVQMNAPNDGAVAGQVVTA